MINPEYITIIFTSIAFLLFAFLFWRDASSEGFSSDKILDAFFIILLGGILGGKLLFHNLGFEYFRYQIWDSALTLEGVLIGGGIAAFFVARHNHWDGWKVGDMIAPALSIFQAILFLGIWVRVPELAYLLIFIGFMLLYFLIRFLKKGFSLGTSASYFQLKRLNKLTFTGGLFALYLTGSSLIAMLFLLTHINTNSWFWWFQIIFYLVIFVVAWILIFRQARIQGIFMSNFFDGIRTMLVGRKKELVKEDKHIDQKDPFIEEANSDEGGRREDEIGDEMQEQMMHADNQAVKADVDEEIKEIDESLAAIKTGQYGICQNCGKPISKERLAAYPTAKYCIDCAAKMGES
jgi:RNA polymerase-binding transcription factor DksA